MLKATSLSKSYQKFFSLLICLLMVLSFFSIVSPNQVQAAGTTYYIDTAGSNSNNGTSASTAWADFTNVNSRTFQPGEQILLKRGCTWTQQMTLQGTGTSTNWISVDAYGTGDRPKIQGSNPETFIPITLTNGDYWSFKNLELSGCRYGIYCNYTTFGHQGLRFYGIYVHDGNYIMDTHAIRINSYESPSSSSEWVVKDIVIDSCESYKQGGIGLVAGHAGYNVPPPTNPWSIKDVVMKNCYNHENYCDMGLQNVSNFTVMDCIEDQNEISYKSQGTTNIFAWDCQNVKFINSMIRFTPNTGSSDQCGFDSEALNDSIQFYGNYIGSNAGAGIEFLQIMNRPGDFNTNHTVSGNTFYNNGTAGVGNFKGSLGYLNTNDGGAGSCTGTASDNLYCSESGGFANGNFNGWTFTNNISVSGFYNTANSFSGTQGQDSWSYQYYNGSTWSNLSYDSTNLYWGTSSSYISRFNLLPNATSTNWIARAWVAPTTGTVSVRGRVLKNDISGGDGVKARVTKNGTVIWPASGTPQTIAYDDQSGYSTNLDSVSVTAGDVIRFEINNGGSGSNLNDATSWIPTVATTLNLALGKTYSSSSSYDANQTAAKAFDGISPGTNWQAANGGGFNGQWVEVNFGTSTTFNKCIMTEYGNRTTGYRIEYWNGSSWQTAYTGTTIGDHTTPKTVTFTAVTGTKARIYYTAGTGYQPILYEFEVYGGENLALGKTYSSSSSYDANQTAAKAFDGISPDTNWQAANGGGFNGQWVEVNFGTSTTFNRCILTEYGNRTTGYRIEYWNGSSWQTAYTGTTIGDNTKPKTVTFTAVTGTKARIYYTAGTEYQPILYEFEIYSQ